MEHRFASLPRSSNGSSAVQKEFMSHRNIMVKVITFFGRKIFSLQTMTTLWTFKSHLFPLSLSNVVKPYIFNISSHSRQLIDVCIFVCILGNIQHFQKLRISTCECLVKHFENLISLRFNRRNDLPELQDLTHNYILSKI